MSNNDLVWALDRFEKKQRAHAFVLGFENRLCVYSGSVQQIYTNYDVFFPKDEQGRLVILPNPYAHHDTFNLVEEAAVKPTGLFIVPAESHVAAGKLNMLLPMKSDVSKFRTVPLEVGLKLINSKRPPSKPFLPVLAKGDLRELNQDTPCLHLHSLQIHHMAMLSALEVKDIERVILSRLAELAKRV